jgi:hypothetical protein
LAIAEHTQGLYGYDFDGESNDWYWAWRRVGRRSVDVSNIFRTVFGDPQMMTRVRPVIEWQLGFTDTGTTALGYVENHYGAGHPISYYFYGGGGSAYYSPSGDYTIDTIWQSGSMNTTNWIPFLKADADICANYGLRRIAYEGGPGLDNTGPQQSVDALAVNDPRMENSVVVHQNVWSQYGGDLLSYFSLAQDYQWGFTADVLNIDTPKMRAISDLDATTRATVTYGHVPSVAVAGNSYDLKSWIADTSWMGSSVEISDGRWTEYTFNIPTDGTYNISVTASRGATPASMIVYVDGVPAATNALTQSSQAYAITQALSAGLHSVRVKASGTIDIASVLVGQ